MESTGKPSSPHSSSKARVASVVWNVSRKRMLRATVLLLLLATVSHVFTFSPSNILTSYLWSWAGTSSHSASTSAGSNSSSAGLSTYMDSLQKDYFMEEMRNNSSSSSEIDESQRTGTDKSEHTSPKTSKMQTEKRQVSEEAEKADRIYYHHEKPTSVFSLELYEDDKTFAAVEYIHLKIESKMIRCTLYDIEKHPADVARFTRAASLPVVTITFLEMRSIIRHCQSLPPVQYFKDLQRYTRRANMNQTDDKLSHALMGIIPGTKWCGMGDIAAYYGDIGDERDVDECCRAHDHCPVRLKSFRFGYGLINLSLYTRSHCDCDIDFYHCLKLTGNPVADLVGQGYFNLIKVGCISEPNQIYAPENCTLSIVDESKGDKLLVKCNTDAETKTDDNLAQREQRAVDASANVTMTLSASSAQVSDIFKRFQRAFLKY